MSMVTLWANLLYLCKLETLNVCYPCLFFYMCLLYIQFPQLTFFLLSVAKFFPPLAYILCITSTVVKIIGNVRNAYRLTEGCSESIVKEQRWSVDPQQDVTIKEVFIYYSAALQDSNNVNVSSSPFHCIPPLNLLLIRSVSQCHVPPS